MNPTMEDSCSVTSVDKSQSRNILAVYQSCMALNLFILCFSLLSPSMWIATDYNVSVGIMSKTLLIPNNTNHTSREIKLNLNTSLGYLAASMFVDVVAILFALSLNFVGSKEFRSKWDYLFMLFPMLSWMFLMFSVHHMSDSLSSLDLNGKPGPAFFILLISQIPIICCGFVAAYITVQVMHTTIHYTLEETPSPIDSLHNSPRSAKTI